MKELFGKPMSLLDNMYSAFGYDWYFWLLPTHPCISINYLEKMYTIKEIKKLKQFDEDNFDEDHKLYANEVRKSTLEKRLFSQGCSCVPHLHRAPLRKDCFY